MSGAPPTEVEDDDEFYESLDRILSSSCSSTSASDDDADPHRRRRPRFPPAAAASLDVWLSEPASVEERRRRLLLQMGLAGDPVLARRRDMSRSVPDTPSPNPNPSPNPHPHSAVHRSRSDCSVGPTAAVDKTLSRADTDDRSRFTIKNLDTGGEFIVKEFREFREVGTGRQLTMEEFEMCVGRSPIVQELMRRQRNAEESNNDGEAGVSANAQTRSKKRGGWLRSIKNAVGGAAQRDRRSSDERDTSSEKGGRRSSSATDDSQDGPNGGGGGGSGPRLTRVRQYGKSQKELTCLYMSQEIHAHNGSIWSIKFSLDGRFLASAGEDCVIHVWQVQKQERKGERLAERVSEDGANHHPFASQNGSPELALGLACAEGGHWEKNRRAKVTGGRKSASSDQVLVPEHLFALSDKPVCTFRGHLDDVLDLSWSKSQYLLSSSMDKTVRLWHMSSNTCLRTFSHSDYVTCIQFNPVDDRFFISGSLDEKVRIWSIPHRQVVDWNDLHEMVTATCYTPDGQGALVGSHKGSCYLYNTSENKLHQQSQIALQNKKRKSSSKKITAFQFAPGSSSEVLITSADSRVRVIDGVELVHKFKGFRNRSSQISASLTANGKYVICASEDSHVYVWRYDADSQPGRRKGSVTVTQSYEHFHCPDVTVALPWPGTSTRGMLGTHISERKHDWLDGVPNSDAPVPSGISGHVNNDYEDHAIILEPNASNYIERVSATWPEEKLLRTSSPRNSSNLCNGGFQVQIRSAWGMVIVTASRGGEIKTFQNFGVPVRI